MILDSHQHFWKYSGKDYAWIDEHMQRIRRDFLPADLESVLKSNRVSGTVAVQACHSEEETMMLLDMADENKFIKGVVGWIDLTDTEVESKLNSYQTRKKLVGIRHVLQGEADDRYMLRPDFLRGLATLDGFSLTYDILIYPKHLPVAKELVSHFPSQRFVIDHIAKPFIKDQKLEPWKSNMKQLAGNPNVYCKISGMVTEASWNAWKREDFFPFLDSVFEAFGEDRVMYGSDWPVCLVAAKSYADVLNIPIAYLKARSPQSLDKFLALNCIRFYKLSLE